MTEVQPARVQALLEDLYRELGNAIAFRRECIDQATARARGRSYQHASETVESFAEAIARIAGSKLE